MIKRKFGHFIEEFLRNHRIYIEHAHCSSCSESVISKLNRLEAREITPGIVYIKIARYLYGERFKTPTEHHVLAILERAIERWVASHITPST